MILSAATYAGAAVGTEVTAVGMEGEALAEIDMEGAAAAAVETAKEGAAATAVGTAKEGVAADIVVGEAAALAVAGVGETLDTVRDSVKATNGAKPDTRHTPTTTATGTTTGNCKVCYLTPDQVGMPLDTAAEEMKRECITIIDPRQLFNDWVDQNILYIHNPNIHSPKNFGYNACSIQLARPVDATVYYTNENKM